MIIFMPMNSSAQIIPICVYLRNLIIQKRNFHLELKLIRQNID